MEAPPRPRAAPDADRLAQAAKDGDIDTVRAMVAGGADVNAFSPSLKCTPLMAACYDGQLECVRELLAHSAVRDIRDSQGYTAVHWAASSWHDNPEILRALLENGHGALASDVTAHGNTPLHRAAAKGNVNQVQHLLKWVATDPLARNDTGNRASDVAVKAGHPTLAQLLIRAEVRAPVLCIPHVTVSGRDTREGASHPDAVGICRTNPTARRMRRGGGSARGAPRQRSRHSIRAGAQ